MSRILGDAASGAARRAPRSRSVRAFFLLAFSVCLTAVACGRAGLEGYDFDGGLLDGSADGAGDGRVDGDARADGGGDADAGDAQKDGEGGACGPSNCANGCCNSSGVCVVGNTLTACGGGGVACEDCLTQGFDFCDAQKKTCARDVIACNAATCSTGCCQAQAPRCLGGESNQACGDNGSACVVCATGLVCNPASHKCEKPTSKCDFTNCLGCCDAQGVCQLGQSNAACGLKGQACEACTFGTSCGPVGPIGGMCEGQPPCGPATCKGCCIGDLCQTGSQNTACGIGGVSCANCTAISEVCNGQSCQIPPPQCNPQNCPNGCCNGTTCVTGSSNTSCGTGGQACQNCAATGGTCQGKVCQPPCNAATCPNGCCNGNTCVAGTTNGACGTGGVVCQNCSNQGQTCQGQVCQSPACNAATCPNGCCNGNTCVTGNTNTLCGTGGVACTNCSAQGNVCSAQKSCIPVCNTTNCPGCCDQAGVCNAGFVNNKCGSGGATCANCTSQNATCNIASVPRVCSNQQTTCPAPYGTCPNGVTTKVLPQQAVCSAQQLADARAACGPGANSASCQSYFSFLQTAAPACGACLTPFHYPFNDGTGLFNCVAPFVKPECNHNTGCAIDCTTQSCAKCPAANVNQCENTVQNGQCQNEYQAASCFTQGLQGAGSFCNPIDYQGNYGRWLEGVGLYYCSP